ncbi:hypothetical protein, partial [Phocaeicola vulgatus]|uniref:hypothetical protein n=1 Tax=Phocaeicola vulgatus TaxID=821 RepID=UPI001C7127CD
GQGLHGLCLPSHCLQYKKMCAKLTKEGMNWLIRLFYELTTAVFRCWEHINQRNLRIIAA